MIFPQYIKKHPAYLDLLTKLTDKSLTDKYLPILEIDGITPSIYEDLLVMLSKDLDKGIISLRRDSPDLRKYLDSLLLVMFNETKATSLIRSIIEYGYQKTNKIEEICDFTIKGDVLRFWPPGLDHPVRVSFFGETIESAVLYDEIYGNSMGEVRFFLLGDIAKLDFKSQLEQIFITNPHLKPQNTILIFGGDSLDSFPSRSLVSFDFEYPTLFYNRLDILSHEINEKEKNGYHIRIFSRNKDLLPDNLQKYLSKGDYIDSGFQSNILKLLVLSDKELFGTIFLGAEAKKLSSERARKILANLEGEIEIGDFIVHEEHGVGIYKGITQEQYTQEIRTGVGEKIKKIIREDYILIEYAEGDELYVPLTQIDKLTKYISIDDQEPEITRLGKTDWESIRNKTKESIYEMAKELIALYAKRELAKTISIDNLIPGKYQDFIDNFPYEITVDQKQTEKDILKDLGKNSPMNRIIVGDVGYGKTEIAMRATYKMVENGYQVAVLCPTTVLTAQHEKVFIDRFSPFNIQVASLSRISSENEKNTIEKISQGKIDIVIGTHRLLSSDIKFKKLGLIVIDEEQKFGVKQKEKLKQLEIGVHVLSMSATPIPRSLSMALSSIQDISIIQTPPQGRKIVKNIVTKISNDKIKEALEYELAREGQVYYLHNKIETIQSTVTRLKRLVSKARIIYAHGQMSPQALKKNVSDFYDKLYDILVCTTIIENGIDMPNVNTIIIEHAQNFGLGQMYQLRGRVGRSDKQAFAYFFYDGEDIDKQETISELQKEGADSIKKFHERRKYKRRLQAMKEINEFGAGFKLASRDLEIRGAGNLLGKQQHGNIKQIGYALYMQMLAEEIEKLNEGRNES